ncbi:DUF1611 domain-containing protein [Paenibacillus sonchi]|uniref:DUF1611 domain-containing protein n=1 Tax=Paenibacillus sonchi TaxID=373687 RepID=UPI001E509847|nr:DUF1611 domain-containing protein [Paenibacillus sonchi]MCE3199564.1 DUF1611 domain-containing protein [Paenibacillus sonchi]
MKRVVLYPFNKITQGLLRFRDLLDVEIVSVIDFVEEDGQDAGAQVDGKHSGILIHSSMADGLKDADTLILNDPGTTFGGNSSVFAEHDLAGLWRELVLYASGRGLKVVSVHEIYDRATLDWMAEQQIQIDVVHSPREQLFQEMDKRYGTGGTDIERYLEQFEKEALMFSRPRSIKRVGIFATRGCIGKFTVQMNLYRQFAAEGIPATAFITEPTGFLFGQPEGDIFKFLAQRPLEQYPYYIDTVIHQAENSGSDWIIMAGQSSILPTMNIAFNSLRYAMLRAFDPEYVLLIAGYDDDGAIHDAIEMLRIYSRRPLALLLPDKLETSYGQYEIYPHERRMVRKLELEQKFQIHVLFIEQAEAALNLLLEEADAIPAGSGK